MLKLRLKMLSWGQLRIDDGLLRPSANNLTFVRVFLASLVIYSHCWGEIVGFDFDNFAPILGAPLSHFGVDGFFAVSGFLVYRSIESKKTLGSFILSRAARLLPGLAAMLAVVATVGAFLTSSSFLHYIAGRETISFIFGNLSFLKPAYTLTGVTCGYAPCNIAGSLWTIPWEVRCYLALVLLRLTNVIKSQSLIWAVVFVSLIFALIADFPSMQHLVAHSLGQTAAFYMERVDRLWTDFVIGIAAYKIHRKLILSWGICAVLVILMITLHRAAPFADIHFQALVIFYFALCLGFLTAKRKAFSASWPDYSYGIYIYAFPVMVAVQALFQLKSPYLLSAATFVLTCILAAASWHLVERPALMWARGRGRSRAAPPIGAAA